MTKDEALKLALEALEEIADEVFSPYDNKLGGAILAIREALASSVATSDTSEKRVDETAKQRHEAQPEQEPVAWMTSTGALYRTEDVDGCFDDTHIPLYTTPPHRKPLTDEEIERFYDEYVVEQQNIVAFARAIEAAHGIKE